MAKKTHRTGKFMSLLLAVVMAFVMALTAVPALADDTATAKNDSITVNNTKSGETYNLYKMFDLTVDDETNPSAYSYTVNSGWSAFFAEGGAGASYITKNAAGYVTAVSDAAALAKAAAAWANKPAAIQTTVASGTTVAFTGLADGYYLITSTLGTVAMIETTPASSAVTVNEKNPEDVIDKKVKEDSNDTYQKNNDAQVGQLVEFKSTATLEPNTRNVYIHDTMDSGLTFTSGSIKIYTDDAMTTELAAENYEVFSTPQGSDTFTIHFTDAYINSLTAETKLYVYYTATLNENAVANSTITDQKNTTNISYGDNQSVQSETTTTTHKFSVYKHAAGSEDNLAGAVFKLEDASGTAIPLIKIDDNNYRVAKTGETGTVDTFTTVASGDIVIWGVDSDAYKLEETSAPAGYNQLTAKVDVTVDKGNATRANVENNKGSALPSTGGMGTTLFYLIGAILVVAAGVILFVRRRVSRG